jgi:hypothetical protein
MDLVPKVLKEETRMFMGLSYFRLMGVVFTLMLSVSFGEKYIHSYLRVAFTIYCVVIFIVLNFKAPQNPRRRVWEGFILWITNMLSPNNFLSIIGYAYKEAEHE